MPAAGDVVAVGAETGRTRRQQDHAAVGKRGARQRHRFGKVAAGQLKEQGITSFAQIAALSDTDVETIDANMPFSADQIRDWREQAKELAK